MDGKEPLGLPWGFEVTHLIFSLTGGLMGDFYTVVLSTSLAMWGTLERSSRRAAP